MKTYGMIFLIGALVGALALYLLFWPEITESEKISVVEKVEWIKKDTTIINYKDSLVSKLVESKPSKEPEKYDSIRTYRGSETFKYGSFEWEARTLGSLDFVKFTPIVTIPTTTKTITKESIKTIHAKGLYVKSYISSDYKFEAGLSYVNKNLIASYSYSPAYNYHRLGLGVKLIGK